MIVFTTVDIWSPVPQIHYALGTEEAISDWKNFLRENSFQLLPWMGEYDMEGMLMVLPAEWEQAKEEMLEYGVLIGALEVSDDDIKSLTRGREGVA